MPFALHVDAAGPPRRVGFRAGVLLALAAFGCASACGRAAAQGLPTGFAAQRVVGQPLGSIPVGIAFLPDGRVLVVEKNTGAVRLATSASTVSVVIGTVPNLTIDGERGLLGVAVDPAWPARPYVYLQSTHTDTTAHLTMYTASGDLTNAASTNLTLASPYLLLRTRNQYGHHNGGTLRFGPDGHLYSSLGDNGFWCEVQDHDFLNGKILRLDVSKMPGPGSGPPPKIDLAPAVHPFPATSDNARLVFARGLRNPFRFTIDSETNDVFIGDVGDLTWEEMDEIVYEGYMGHNFGWPEREGFVPSMCCPIPCTHHPPYVDPIYVYPNPPDPLSAAVIAGPLYQRVLGSPQSFGAAYDGSLFFGDQAAGWMRRLVKTNGTWELAAPVAGQPNALDWATQLGGVVDIQTGPDGALYIVVLGGGALGFGVWRIVPTSAVDVDDAAGGAAARVRAFPNPARLAAGITLEYELSRREPVRVDIFDVAGRAVRSLYPPAASTGSLRWDGRAANGLPAAPGVYLYRLTTTTGTQATGRFSLQR
jgi:glucose/arabinose dehydrogenase